MTTRNEQYVIHSLIVWGKKSKEDDHLFQNLSTSWI